MERSSDCSECPRPVPGPGLCTLQLAAGRERQRTGLDQEDVVGPESVPGEDGLPDGFFDLIGRVGRAGTWRSVRDGAGLDAVPAVDLSQDDEACASAVLGGEGAAAPLPYGGVACCRGGLDVVRVVLHALHDDEVVHT